MVPPWVLTGVLSVVMVIILLSRFVGIDRKYEGPLNQLMDKVPSAVFLIVGVLSSLVTGIYLWDNVLNNNSWEVTFIFLVIIPSALIYLCFDFGGYSDQSLT